MAHSLPARGFAAAALVLFICACSPPDQPPPPAPGSLEAAVQTMRTGDVEALRAHLGKEEGLAARGLALTERLDPAAWLVAMGAHEREHDLAKAYTAMQAGDDAALADALGFGRQALRRDVLNGGGSIHIRAADARKYYQKGPQPIALIEGISPPGLPAGADAMQVTLWGRLEGRELRVRYGLAEGVTDLAAGIELGREALAVPEDKPRHGNARDALPRAGLWHNLDLSSLSDPRWYGARFLLLDHEGGLHSALLSRDSGWVLLEHESTTRQERLGEIRDRRLALIARYAGTMLRTSGRWPQGLHELAISPRELYDPAAPDAGNGWAEYGESQGPAARPAAPGFELAPDPDGPWQAAALHGGPKGRRAATSNEILLWIE